MIDNQKKMALANAFKIAPEHVDYLFYWKKQQNYMCPKTRRSNYQLGTNSKIEILAVFSKDCLHGHKLGD